MAKPTLKPEYSQLEKDLIDTFLAGHNSYRPDLAYPQSHSDMQAGVRALMIMYDIKRRPLALPYKELLPNIPANCGGI